MSSYSGPVKSERQLTDAERLAERIENEPLRSFCHPPATEPWVVANISISASEKALIISALRSHPSPVVPDGYVLLPIKLTPEIACALENCAPPDRQTPDALQALVEDYAQTWAKVCALAAPAATLASAPPAPQPALPSEEEIALAIYRALEPAYEEQTEPTNSDHLRAARAVLSLLQRKDSAA